jgi:hypothetical protein
MLARAIAGMPVVREIAIVRAYADFAQYRALPARVVAAEPWP